jgi:hypothetical protein
MKGNGEDRRDIGLWNKEKENYVLSGEASQSPVSGAVATLFLWAHCAAMEIRPPA